MVSRLEKLMLILLSLLGAFILVFLFAGLIAKSVDNGKTQCEDFCNDSGIRVLEEGVCICER